MFTLGFSFQTGTKTIGGSTSILFDFNDDSKTYSFNPSGGVFISNNVLIEGGFYYHNHKHGDSDPYDYSYNYYTFTAGARYFLNNTYAGFAYQSNPKHSEYDYEYNREKMHIKIGMLSPIATNIYLNYNFDYNWYLNDDEDDGIMTINCGISYFWN